MKITQKSSPNKFSGRKGWKPDLIVCHITEGYYAGAVSWLCNPDSKASSHFVVSQKGEVTQLVPLEDGSWCNGTGVSSSSDSRHYSKSTHPLVKSRKTNANYYTVTIEFEGFSKNGGALTAVQTDTAVELIRHIKTEVKRIFGVDIQFNRQSIIGHYEINPITKPNCPGKNFPFNEIIARLNGGATVLTNIPMEVTTDKLNVRNSPVVNNTNIIGVLNTGDKVTVLQTEGVWRKVKYGESTGWVHSKYLKDYTPPTPKPEPVPTPTPKPVDNSAVKTSIVNQAVALEAKAQEILNVAKALREQAQKIQ